MHRAAEVLSWPSDDDEVGQPDDAATAQSWFDLGDLGSTEPPTDDWSSPPRGGGRVPRYAWWLVVGAVAAAVVVPAAWTSGAKTAAFYPDGHLSPPVPTFSVSQLPKTVDLPTQLALAARDPSPLVDQMRYSASKGQCPLVRIGATSPVTRVEAAVRKVLPRYHRIDSSRTLDQFAGLCLLQYRAGAPDGTVLVLTVIPPTPGLPKPDEELLSLQSHHEGAASATTASEFTTAGWRINVGVVGDEQILPDMSDVEQIAVDHSMIW